MILIWNLENSIHILTFKGSINFKLNLSEIKLNEIINDMLWRYHWRSKILGKRRIHIPHGTHATDIHLYLNLVAAFHEN